MSHTGLDGYGHWPIVIGSVLFMTFLVGAAFKSKTRRDWKSMGSLSAFFVALFTEMYGFPLTIYLLSSWLGKNYPVADPFSHSNGHLLRVFSGNSPLVSFLIHPGTDILLLAALIIISAGWKRIYRAQGGLVTEGVYRYVRHPQYAGFMLIILAFLIQWPTLVTLPMGFILIWRYHLLAVKEEKEMLESFGESYRSYMAATPRYSPLGNALKMIWRRRKGRGEPERQSPRSPAV